MAGTVQLLRHGMYCPISAEIRTVDSQYDLQILLYFVVMIKLTIIFNN